MHQNKLHVNNKYEHVYFTICFLCLPNKQVENVNIFGQSWAVNPNTCDMDPDPVDPCVEGSEEYAQAQDLCYVVIAGNGPFISCFELVDPAPYHFSCVYDLCATLPDDDVLCDSLAVYAQACRDAGGSPGDWRDETPQCGKYQNEFTETSKSS